MSSPAQELVVTPRESVAPAELRHPATRDWLAQTLEAAVFIAVLDAVLVQRKYNLFTGGFVTSSHVETFIGAIAFFAAAVVVNCWVTAPGCALGVLAGDRLRLSARGSRFLALCCGVLPLAAADFLDYQIWAYLGDAFDFNLLFDLTGRRLSEVLAVMAPLLARPVFLAVVLLAGVIVTTWVIDRRSSSRVRQDRPPLRRLVQGCAAALLLATAVIGAVVFTDKSVVWGLRKLPAAQPILWALEWMSDVDGDGFGVLSAPQDPAPFTKSIHPYALEIPGNGVDEDGVAGDLPADFSRYVEPVRPFVPWAEKPPFVLVVLESFRADIVGTMHLGQPVTPVLDGLVRDGLKVDSAWSQNGFTSQSRFHILSGSLAGAGGGTSILDDFKRQGYEVAYFSAQDDSFGSVRVNYDSVDTYYDARRDLDNRYTQYTTPGSLAVPASVLESKIRAFLDARQSPAPLFLYVNFHDTHYPYVYKGIDNLLNIDFLPPRLISPERREELWATYLNTAANVDRGIGRVLHAVSLQTRRTPAVVVIGDHGESLFEEGFLGHGYAINESQTRIPLVVSQLPMKVESPFGQVDLRNDVADALEGRNGPLDAKPSVDRGTGGRVFQYLGGFDQPGQISWLTTSGRIIYDFRNDEVSIDGQWAARSSLSGDHEKLWRDLIYTWESMRLTRARAEQATAPQ